MSGGAWWNMPGPGDPETWGGRSPEPEPDEDDAPEDEDQKDEGADQ